MVATLFLFKLLGALFLAEALVSLVIWALQERYPAPLLRLVPNWIDTRARTALGQVFKAPREFFSGVVLHLAILLGILALVYAGAFAIFGTSLVLAGLVVWSLYLLYRMVKEVSRIYQAACDLGGFNTSASQPVFEELAESLKRQAMHLVQIGCFYGCLLTHYLPDFFSLLVMVLSAEACAYLLIWCLWHFGPLWPGAASRQH